MTITILDGSIGQELVHRSNQTPTPLWSTKTMLDTPALVREVHDAYFAVGAEIATTNTYPVHRDRLVRHDLEHQFADLHKIACELAVASRDANGRGSVAGSLGPTGWSYRPDLAPPADQAAEVFAEIARLHEPYVDIHLLETMCSVDQARGGMMGAAVTGKPVWLGVSVADEDGGKLRSGEPITDLLPLLQEIPPAVLLINCSTPEAVTTAIDSLTEVNVTLGAYANGFTQINADFTKTSATVDALAAREDLGPRQYAAFADNWVAGGATIIGGCCEVGPDHIKELVQRLK